MGSTARVSDVGQITQALRIAVVAVAWLFTAGAVVQVFLAGLSVFDSASYWSDHVDFGRVLGFLAYALPILALAGRIGWRLGIQALVVALLYILQSALAFLDNGMLAAFHAVNALLLIGAAGILGGTALALVRHPDGHEAAWRGGAGTRAPEGEPR